MLSLQLLPWTARQKFLFRFIFCWVILLILTIPFAQPLIPDLPALWRPFFEHWAWWTGTHFFHLPANFTAALVSDSPGLKIHLLHITILSLFLAFIWSRLQAHVQDYHRLYYWFRVLCAFFLAYYMLVYGLNKLFKWQFYIPEPNTLYTPLGQLHRDILYWSAMGSSYSYNLFLGGAECSAAILLLFKRTRVLGALFSLALLVNIVQINFSFDIDVKIFSSFLLLLSLLILIPETGRMYRFFILRREKPGSPAWEPVYIKKDARRFYFIVKTILIGWVGASTLFVYIKSGNFNDDKMPRPDFHGAWEVDQFIRNNDTLLPLTTDTVRWKRVFIHRRGYLILQQMNDSMKDYLFTADTALHYWGIQQNPSAPVQVLRYKQIAKDSLILETATVADTLEIHLHAVPLQRLPLLQDINQ